MERYGALARYVGTTAGQEVHTTFARDLTRELVRTRSRGYDVMIGPAHVIGSAIRYGYEPLTRFPGEEHAVFIASAASGVTTLAGTAGKRLALPPADSLATYLARGDVATEAERDHLVAQILVEGGGVREHQLPRTAGGDQRLVELPVVALPDLGFAAVAGEHALLHQVELVVRRHDPPLPFQVAVGK